MPRGIDKVDTSASAVPVQLPIGKEDNFIGQVDIIEMKAVVYAKDDKDGSKFDIVDIPSDMQADAEAEKKFFPLLRLCQG